MNITISGASGFIGQYVFRHFAKNNLLILLTRNKYIDTSELGKHCKIVDISCSDKKLKEELKETEVFIHLAAKRPSKKASDQNFSDYIDILRFTDRILKALQDSVCKQIINISTKGVYGKETTIPFTEDQVPFPSSMYGWSKVFTEQMLDRFGTNNNIRVCHLRLAQVIGWGDKQKNIISVLLDNAIRKQTQKIWGKGVGARTYVYIKDVVTAIEHCLNFHAQGVYNIGWHKAISHYQMAESINQVFENNQLEYLTDKPEDTSIETISTYKAKAVLNWEPVFLTLKDALLDMKKDYEEGTIRYY